MADKDIVKDIKKLIDTKNLIIGTKKTIKGLKRGAVKKIIISSNCPKDVIEDLEYYAKLCNAEITEIDKTNIELAVICKRQHPISVLSIT